MNEIGIVIVNRCIKIIIMLIPSLLWATLIMCDICFGISHVIFNMVTYLIMTLLCFSMLFLNSILKIEFPDNSFENMHYEIKKPKIKEIWYRFITGLPLVLILFLAPIWVFIIYGFIQAIYIIIDKDHMSIMERLYHQGQKLILHINIKRFKSNKSIDQEDSNKQIKQA